MNTLFDHPRLKSLDLSQTVNFILKQQDNEGAISWYNTGKLDPWDHVEAAMALTVAGEYKHALQAYQWLQEKQQTDGSWHANYFSSNDHKLYETNFIAYIATGVWHYYLCTGDQQFLHDIFPCINTAIECVLSYQSPEGEIAWAFNQQKNAENDALLTACSSILRSLECAISSAQVLGIESLKWQRAWHKLHNAICEKPERFDRSWASKARFAMDWYYPILGGALSTSQAKQRLKQRWNEFVVPDLGCRCVNDEPWITVAESCELVISLVAVQKHKQAEKIFNDVQQWRDTDGAYWTGYVFRDNKIWPQEKTSWTAGAIILAADALYNISPASKIFTRLNAFK